MSKRPKYEGPDQKLVLALDVGTTFSGISYAILEPGVSPEIKSVTRFPNQEQIGGDSKIPTVIFYDQEGQIRARGAETLMDSVRDTAEQEQWCEAKWFKLHFRPNNIGSSLDEIDIPPLPPGKTAVQVLSDFLRYLVECAQEYVTQSLPGGQALWDSLKDTMTYVLTHPNGWLGRQQTLIREAAVIAGLVSDSFEDFTRIEFVTEGEASLHYCIYHGLSEHIQKAGKDNGVIVADAGGGTVDISAYSATGEFGSDFQELCQPECLLSGSVIVTRNASRYLSKKLSGSRFEEDVKNIVIEFDKKTKLHFRNVENPYYIKFGVIKDNAPDLDIARGQLKLPGSVVAGFFNPCIDSIYSAITERISPGKPITAIFLVGGFAASDYMFTRLKELFEPLGAQFCRPDSHTNKAVSEGAVSYVLDHRVSKRISRLTYGLRTRVDYKPEMLEHRDRQHLVFRDPISEDLVVPGYFARIVPKGAQVSESKEFRKRFSRSILATNIQQVALKIHTYHGEDELKWMDQDKDSFRVACIVDTDLREYTQYVKPKQGLKGLYYDVDFEIVLSFGTTEEIKAEIAWNQEGEEKRSPARVTFL